MGAADRDIIMVSWLYILDLVSGLVSGAASSVPLLLLTVPIPAKEKARMDGGYSHMQKGRRGVCVEPASLGTSLIMQCSVLRAQSGSCTCTYMSYSSITLWEAASAPHCAVTFVSPKFAGISRTVNERERCTR